jgi:hypothetical protein
VGLTAWKVKIEDISGVYAKYHRLSLKLLLEGSRSPGFKDSSEMLKNYKELNVWQKSYERCLKIYRITAKFPNEERYSLKKRTSQKSKEC